MNRKIENILLGVLWLLGATLGTCFWFNTRFGFNLFSSTHWEYLAMQQATRTPISFWFYFSFVAATIITLFGLYLLIRPRFRKIRPSKKNITKSTPPTPVSQQQVSQPIQTPAFEQPKIETPTLIRPPRLNIAPSNTFAPAQNTAVVNASYTQTTQPAQQTLHTQDNEKLREIFSLAHYIIKKEPRINGIQMSVLAIGTDEILYLGATGISTQQMHSCVSKLTQIFSDTLDDVEIHVIPFILHATDVADSHTSDILIFDTLQSVRDYMKEHTNPPLTADDDGNFDAYSEYISTVIDYIGKL